MLWFDVGNGRYTTHVEDVHHYTWLWFDVGNGRYTTHNKTPKFSNGCGLM